MAKAKTKKPAPDSQRVEMPLQHRLAPMQPDSVDGEARTAEVVWTTGARVERFDFFSGEPFLEELATAPENVRMDRMNNGAPLLDSHRRFGLAGQIGVVERASLSNGEGQATVRFSAREEVEPIFRDVQDGIVRNVSVGYRVHKIEKERLPDGVMLLRVVDWEPMEVSLVPVGADAGAGVRADDEHKYPCVIIDRAGSAQTSEADMPKKTATASAAESQPSNESTRTEGQVATPESADAPATAPTAERAIEAAPVAAPEVDAAVARALTAERRRTADITDACRTFGFEDLADEFVRNGVGVDAVRAELQKRFAERARASRAGLLPAAGSVQMGYSAEDPEVIRGRFAEAIAARGLYREPDESARELAGMGVMDLARELLPGRGRGLSVNEIAARALTSTDFPNILAAGADKILLARYGEFPATYPAISARMELSDFKTKNLLRLGDFPELKEVEEDGEYTYGALGESNETIRLATFGRLLPFTRQMLINDDLGAFTDTAGMIGEAVRRFENKQVWAVVTANQALADGTALFHADHGNLAASGGAPSVATIGKGKEAMRKQKSIDGETINLMPATIAVPASLETLVEQILSDLVLPTKPADLTPRSQRQLEQVIEPLLDAASATAWYLFASPSRRAGVVYANLQGVGGPETFIDDPFTRDGVVIKVRRDFAAAVEDFRGTYKNAGA
ncbi:MAG: Mu-like prophage major head subunit gpT family protein [Kiloniellales bacterium]|nr:Mu-like prophage major head subunit gpT family protein [Kiloniellales bacterium]